MRARECVLAPALAAALVLTGSCSSRDAATASRDTVADARTGSAIRIADDLPPLPATAVPARPPDAVRTAFEFAARHPEVLQYIPCVCGCEHMGHRGNADCFVGKRDSAGRVTEWVAHGMVCEVCIDIANDARQLHNSGASVASIRRAIEARYASPDRGHTPTPEPPAEAGAAR